MALNESREKIIDKICSRPLEKWVGPKTDYIGDRQTQKWKINLSGEKVELTGGPGVAPFIIFDDIQVFDDKVDALERRLFFKKQEDDGRKRSTLMDLFFKKISG